jgi:hypothetical protein
MEACRVWVIVFLLSYKSQELIFLSEIQNLQEY